MTPDDISWPVLHCCGETVFFEPSESFSNAYFGGPLERSFSGQSFGPHALHRVLTVSPYELAHPKGHKLQGKLPFFFGMRFDGQRIRYGIPTKTVVDSGHIDETAPVVIRSMVPTESSDDWPYEHYPELFPYHPLCESKRVNMSSSEFEESFTWQGLELASHEMAVVVPSNPYLGVSMWGRMGDEAGVIIVFVYNFKTQEVRAESQCT